MVAGLGVCTIERTVAGNNFVFLRTEFSELRIDAFQSMLKNVTMVLCWLASALCSSLLVAPSRSVVAC